MPFWAFKFYISKPPDKSAPFSPFPSSLISVPFPQNSISQREFLNEGKIPRIICLVGRRGEAGWTLSGWEDHVIGLGLIFSPSHDKVLENLMGSHEKTCQNLFLFRRKIMTIGNVLHFFFCLIFFYKPVYDFRPEEKQFFRPLQKLQLLGAIFTPRMSRSSQRS